jgi:hypothetical protein
MNIKLKKIIQKIKTKFGSISGYSLNQADRDKVSENGALEREPSYDVSHHCKESELAFMINNPQELSNGARILGSIVFLKPNEYTTHYSWK